MASNKILKIMIVLVVIIIIIIAIILGILSNHENLGNNSVNEVSEKSQIYVERVKNRNDFFTVTSCVSRYVTYLTTKETDILYDYLDEEYKEKNNITRQNIFSFVKTLDDYYSFKGKEMYVYNISNTLSQYYVYGTLKPENGDMEENSIEEVDFYISIKLDKANNTFSVIPNLYINGLNVKD